MRISLILLFLCIITSTVYADEYRGLNIGLELAKQKTDFDYSGTDRETRLTRLGILWHEKLSPSILGGVELGYIEITQYSNPIPAGQTGSGEYIGLNLSFILLNTNHIDLLTRLAYRYNDARHTIDDQSIDWDWHEGRISLLGQLKFTEHFALSLGASALMVDGRETASGPVTQARPFKADTPFSGHIGLQLGLDPAGTIGIEIDSGSVQGGRLYFQRVF